MCHDALKSPRSANKARVRTSVIFDDASAKYPMQISCEYALMRCLCNVDEHKKRWCCCDTNCLFENAIPAVTALWFLEFEWRVMVKQNEIVYSFYFRQNDNPNSWTLFYPTIMIIQIPKTIKLNKFVLLSPCPYNQLKHFEIWPVDPWNRRASLTCLEQSTIILFPKNGRLELLKFWKFLLWQSWRDKRLFVQCA